MHFGAIRGLATYGNFVIAWSGRPFSMGGALITEAMLFPKAGNQSEVSEASPETLAEFLRACERTYITNVLEQNGDRIADTANALGISRKNLWEKMKKLELEAGVSE